MRCVRLSYDQGHCVCRVAVDCHVYGRVETGCARLKHESNSTHCPSPLTAPHPHPSRAPHLSLSVTEVIATRCLLPLQLVLLSILASMQNVSLRRTLLPPWRQRGGGTVS
jgi:hypothetical protein